MVGEKKLTPEEKECAILLWGCIPVDLNWIRQCKLFQEKFKNMFP